MTELTRYYCVTLQKICILDSMAFESTFELLDYLKYLQTFGCGLNILVVNEKLSDCPSNKKNCPWIFGEEITVNTIKRALIDISNAHANIQEVINFYAVYLKRYKLSITQSIIISHLMNGLSIKEISHAIGIPFKRVYHHARSACVLHNQRTIIQLVHFFCVNKSAFRFCKDYCKHLH